MKLKNIMINIKVKILEKALEKIIKNKLNKLVDELEVKVKILQNGGIIEHKSNIEEEAKLNRQKIPAITLEKYLDEAIKRWRNELGISKTKEDKLIAKCNIDTYQSVRVSMLGELLPKEEK